MKLRDIAIYILIAGVFAQAGYIYGSLNPVIPVLEALEN